jgi:hypothetical protein
MFENFRHGKDTAHLAGVAIDWPPGLHFRGS